MMKATALDIVKALYASFRRQDSEYAINLFADDAVIHGPTTSEILPWGGSYIGRNGARQFFELLGKGLDVQQLDMLDFVTHAERVVVLGHIAGNTREARKSFATDFAHIFKIDLDEGKILEFRVFNDSASLARSMNG
jgi:uncharacterized protein